MTDGSGGAPQLDERTQMKLAEVLADDEQNDKVRQHHIRLAARILRTFPLAASSRGGELDLTDDEERAIVHELETFVIPMFATVGEHITEEGRERRDAINAARSKLRARLDRKDDE